MNKFIFLVMLLASIVVQAGDITVKNGELMRKGKPFFPIGFVSALKDQWLQESKAVGMNSVHSEFSIIQVMPDSEKASEKGLKYISDCQKMTKRNDMVFFTLLTGHYIPGWLGKIAGPHPVNAKGEKIGFWFPHSIHNAKYRKALETFWTIVAKKVGNDPNVVYVSWNEPAYGLDHTPDAIDAYRKAMIQKYGNIDKFNKAMETNFKDFKSIIPPESPDKQRRYWYKWFCYNQQAFADFFQWQRNIFKKYGGDVAMSGKNPVQALTGDSLYCNDIALLTAVQDIPGCDLYNGSLFHYRNGMEIMRSLNPLGPVVSYETRPQYGIPPLKPNLAALQLFAQILGGCRGMFFYSHGKGDGFGFDSDKATPPLVRAELTRLFKLINKYQSIFASPRKKAEIAVLVSNPSTVHYAFAATGAGRDKYTKRLTNTYDLVRNQHFAVDFISDRQLKAKLDKYKLLVVPSLSILSESNLDLVAKFHRNGGKILAFGGSFARDEVFALCPVPSFLGIKSRGAAPWNRGQMRLTEVISSLNPYFLTEITVQSPEQVNPLPMEKAIPGYLPQTGLKDSIVLVGNQDAYPSVIQSNDKQVVYCAFDSLYGEGLSRLIGGIVSDKLGMAREISIKRQGENFEALEIISALNVDRTLLLGNAGPNPGTYSAVLDSHYTGKLTSIVNGQVYDVKDGNFNITLPGYGYDILTVTGK